jgi:hypothetical protein
MGEPTMARVEGLRNSWQPAIQGARDDPDDGVATSRARDFSIDVAGTAPIAPVTVIKHNEAWRIQDGTEDVEADLDADSVEHTWTDEA